MCKEKENHTIIAHMTTMKNVMDVTPTPTAAATSTTKAYNISNRKLPIFSFVFIAIIYS